MIPVERKGLGCKQYILVPAEPRPHERYSDFGSDSGFDFDLGNVSARPKPREADLVCLMWSALKWLPRR